MSECGYLILVALAIPVVALVLLAAGVGALAVAGARLVEQTCDTLGLESRLRSALQTEYGRILSGNLHAQGMLASTPLDSRLLVQPPNLTPDPGSDSSLLTKVTDRLARAGAVREALNQETPLRLVAERWHTDELLKADEALAKAQALYVTGKLTGALAEARLAERTLSVATYDSHQRLLMAQQTVLIAQTEQSLTGMGYQVERLAGSQDQALWATNDGRTIAALVEPSGRLLMDMAGFDGVACHREAEQMLVALEQNGVEVRREQVLLHGRRDGGPLVARLHKLMKPEPQAEPSHQPTARRPDRDQYRRAVAWLWQQQQAGGAQA